MFSLIFLVLYVLFYLLGSIAFSVKVSLLLKKGNIAEHDKLVDHKVSSFARSVLRLAGAQVEISGLDNLPDGAAVFISNHQSDLDSMVILGYIGRTKSFFAKDEMKKVPLLSSWMRHMRCIFVNRKSHAAASRAIREAVTLLKSGYSMVIFPEGTRSKTGTIGEFKYGAFKMADAAGVPIVPIKITGTRDVFENNKFSLKKGKVTATILPSVAISDLPDDQKAQIHKTVRDMLENA